MAPLRRYLRITKHSVLEVRIYLDRPADAEAWLLKRGDPALPRVIQAIRPLVLPKLREENERGRGKGSAKAKKKGVKDVVVEALAVEQFDGSANARLDDFEVSVFLTELSSRHSVLTKQKIFKDKARIQSNSGKLTNWLATGTSDQPVIVNGDPAQAIVIREEDEDDKAINLADIPEADKQPRRSRRSARSGRTMSDTVTVSSESDSSDMFFDDPPAGRGKSGQSAGHTDQDVDNDTPPNDDKKKLGLNTSYDGFSIYGRILCLVVKRRGVKSRAGGPTAASQSSQMMEAWVSTQAVAEQFDADDD
ncbi:hypothetical protein LEMA_P120710.1 [Plenodomus lingam JN3]|uniref:Uncharacterized protein n=1 Tax=Leptosphaeria maculans (strain JN3 / isolate v23.1.3 / race Av1-4-5-6-7-8) TaxID=985895 RepID=E4ZSZ2_LEPMJ|nr:hypothetical protein LEMA_P120710.1 [Plenodomus lingam JN3]CBX94580.1 hypothetical protein LEMA_P120710.1 [Plenodomus lingam JN3]